MKRFMKIAVSAAWLLSTTLLVSACNASPGAATTTGDSASAAATPAPLATPATTSLPLVTVHKSPDCGCCGVWVEHVRKAGFPVRVNDTGDMAAIKQRLGIPAEMQSCHTAEVDGYVVEGHVPVADIQRLLAERPQARGLVLPGMPIGSPGMESPDGYTQRFTVGLLEAGDEVRGFSEHP